MTDEVIKEYYTLTGELETLLYGMKWLNNEKNDIHYKNIIEQSENLWRKFLAFGINNIGYCEE